MKFFPFKIHKKTPLTTRLDYLDEILKILSSKLGNFVNEDEVVQSVSFEKNEGGTYATKEKVPEGRERMLFRTATIYLEDLGLIIKKTTNPEVPDYMISFKGLDLIENGGLLKQRKKENLKDNLQKLFWILAFVAFATNTVFQIMNYSSSKKTCNIDSN